MESSNMKIVVYAIAKNEEKHVDRFMDSVSPEADAVYVLDTGSTDKTVEMLRNKGAIVVQKEITPWRFDVARNESLSIIPDDVDVCVCIDLDEVIKPGWRASIEKVWKDDTTSLHYQYIWSHNPDGTSAVIFWISKIHSRKNIHWIHPVHEIIECYDVEQKVIKCDEIEVHHYPDQTKSRSSYLPLLELAVEEDPDNDRNSHYLGREYMLYGKFEEAIVELKRHLQLKSATWDVERAASMRFICRCYGKLGKWHEARTWALRACAETPFEREPWWDLANVAHATKDFRTAYYAATQALSNGKQGERYIADPTAWSYGPYDYASIGAHFIGFKEDAVKYAKAALNVALKHKESEEIISRIKKNLAYFERLLSQKDGALDVSPASLKDVSA
jgi:glycosyltransferase involved in cell wall biosynthesis